MVGIPAYNESETIGKTVEQIRKCIPEGTTAHIVVINDGSTDDTTQKALKSGADVIIEHDRNYGVGMTYQTAISYAVKNNIDVICTIDADLQYNPSQIPNLPKPIIVGETDLVIGSRFLDTKNNKNIPISNLVGNRLMAAFVSLLVGYRIHDVESGFRAFSVDASKNIRVMGIGSFAKDMILDFMHNDYSIKEVPVSVKYYNGRTSRAIGSFIKYGLRSVFVIALKMFSLHMNIGFCKGKKSKARILYNNPTIILSQFIQSK